jgi:MFS family permease
MTARVRLARVGWGQIDDRAWACRYQRGGGAGGRRFATPARTFAPTRARDDVRCSRDSWLPGYAFATLGVGAPFIAKSFGLDQSGIARMFAWIATDAFGVMIVSRMADRMGRRRILMWSLVATPLCAIGAALSESEPWFIIFVIGMYSFVGATFASAIVMLAEALSVRWRARGQGYGGLSVGLGAALCVILMPWLAQHNLSWRWLLVVPSIGFVAVPFMLRVLPESRRWEEVAARGSAQRTRFYDVFGPFYRRRAVPLMVAAFVGRLAVTGVRSWQYYHADTVIGLTPAQGSAVLLFGGGLAGLGFPIGAWAAERSGACARSRGSGSCALSVRLRFIGDRRGIFVTR